MSLYFKLRVYITLVLGPLGKEYSKVLAKIIFDLPQDGSKFLASARGIRFTFCRAALGLEQKRTPQGSKHHCSTYGGPKVMIQEPHLRPNYIPYTYLDPPMYLY